MSEIFKVTKAEVHSWSTSFTVEGVLPDGRALPMAPEAFIHHIGSMAGKSLGGIRGLEFAVMPTAELTQLRASLAEAEKERDELRAEFTERERKDDFDAKRLRVLARVLGCEDAVPDDATAVACAGTVLGSFRRAAEELVAERDRLAGEVEKKDAELEAEQGRWQDAIYKLVCGLAPEADIDGGGCDSGDPLDLTLDEIGQGFSYWDNLLFETLEEIGHVYEGSTFIAASDKIKSLTDQLSVSQAAEKEAFRKVAVDFFYWWHNQPGSNTVQDFDTWWNSHAEASTLPALKAWIDGEPLKPYCNEWFIALTTYGDKVVLRALPDEFGYDYKTADETYIKRDKIKAWMQFPDSAYVPFQAPRTYEQGAEVCEWKPYFKEGFYITSCRDTLAKGPVWSMRPAAQVGICPYCKKPIRALPTQPKEEGWVWGKLTRKTKG